jgi:hypothetical protein
MDDVCHTLSRAHVQFWLTSSDYLRKLRIDRRTSVRSPTHVRIPAEVNRTSDLKAPPNFTLFS